MTQEDFKKLSLGEQEDFINSGGIIERSTSGVQRGSPDVTPKEELDAKSVVSSGGSSDVPPTPPEYSQYYDGFDIKDPLELLYLLDDDVIQGHITLHPWQIQFLVEFAHQQWQDTDPFQAIVRACNGSGKDKYIIAPCAVWLCMRFRLARGVVTSASGQQLDTQTEAYIRQLCEAANKKYANGKQDIWKCNYRYYECLPTQSPIILFATDEPGKAEGYHPLGFKRKMALFESEAKTVPDEINTAQDRCTGFTHRVIVSTPGLPMGHFFDLDCVAIDRRELGNITERKPTEYVKWVVSYRECSHISEAYAEQIASKTPGGRNSPFWKSMFLAEFGTTDEMVVIPYTYVWQAFTFTESRPSPKWISEPFNKAGLDLSDGGDETVLTIRNGNKHIKTIPFRFDNTEDTVSFLDEQFKVYGLNHPEAYIFADCGGLGKPILDRLKRMGWVNIRYVDNRAKAYRPKTYLNRGAEMWFNIRLLFERHEIILLKEDKLIRQLSTRYYKINSNNIHQLLSKIESRSRGYPSPDRADSFVLAFSDYKTTFKESDLSADKKPFEQPDRDIKPVGSFHQQLLCGGKHDSVKKRLGKRRDTSIYQMQIDQFNQSLRMNRQTVEQPSTPLVTND